MKLLLCPPVILKATARTDGDGWKDSRKAGEVVFVHAEELPKPHARGEYLRCGETNWTISDKDWDLVPATAKEVKELFLSRFVQTKLPTA